MLVAAVVLRVAAFGHYRCSDSVNSVTPAAVTTNVQAGLPISGCDRKNCTLRQFSHDVCLPLTGRLGSPASLYRFCALTPPAVILGLDPRIQPRTSFLHGGLRVCRHEPQARNALYWRHVESRAPPLRGGDDRSATRSASSRRPVPFTTMSPKSVRISAANCFQLHLTPRRKAQARRRQCLLRPFRIASQLTRTRKARTLSL